MTLTKNLKSTFDFKLWMYTVLMIEADKWAWSIKGSSELSMKFKQKFNQVLDSNNDFIRHIKDNNILDLLEDQGEWFSKALEVIHDTDSLKMKEELVLVLREYSEGRVDNCDDYLPKEQVLEFVSRFSILPKETIEEAYNKYKDDQNRTHSPTT